MKKNYFILFILIFTFGCLNESGQDKVLSRQPKSISNQDRADTFECEFKTNQNKKCWTRVGVYPIDSIAEEFACHLMEKEFTNILVAKYIGDNGAFENESAFVLWIESNKEYVKEFYTTNSLDVLEKPKSELNWKSLRMIFDSKRLDTIISKPESEIMISHDIGFAVQYFSPKNFFCERLQDTQWQSAIDETHPKVIFWKELTDLLQPITKR